MRTIYFNNHEYYMISLREYNDLLPYLRVERIAEEGVGDLIKQNKQIDFNDMYCEEFIDPFNGCECYCANNINTPCFNKCNHDDASDYAKKCWTIFAQEDIHGTSCEPEDGRRLWVLKGHPYSYYIQIV